MGAKIPSPPPWDFGLQSKLVSPVRVMGGLFRLKNVWLKKLLCGSRLSFSLKCVGNVGCFCAAYFLVIAGEAAKKDFSFHQLRMNNRLKKYINV